MRFEYRPRGTCSRKIELDIDGDGIITSCVFLKGCSGNLQGVGRLVRGRHVDEVIGLLEGIVCQNGTSCPDQLALALKSWKAQQGD